MICAIPRQPPDNWFEISVLGSYKCTRKSNVNYVGCYCSTLLLKISHLTVKIMPRFQYVDSLTLNRGKKVSLSSDFHIPVFRSIDSTNC